MADASTPPLKSLLASAGGGFGGAFLGVVAATALMGNGDNGDGQTTGQAVPDQPTEVIVAERQE